MRNRSWALGLLLLSTPVWTACAGMRGANPPAPGFDREGSDERAIEIADEVMAAMGGRAAWDEARVLAWNFFGRRRHVWDKHTGEYRLEEGDKVVRMNLGSGAGVVFVKGGMLTDEAQRAEELARAKSIWINDSYWLVMPYKLKDSGVRLAYLGEAQLADGRAADRLELSFTEVGDTPNNRYWVDVARDTRLVESWSFFENREDPTPRFSTPWADWKEYGGILLSGTRSPGRSLSEIAVLDAPPAHFDALP